MEMVTAFIKVFQSLETRALSRSFLQSLPSIIVRYHLICTLTMDLSVLIIDVKHELNKILESTNLHEYELIDLPIQQSGDLSHKHTGVGMACTLDTAFTCMSGLAPLKGSSTKLLLGFDTCYSGVL